MTPRWLIVLATAAALVATPLLVDARTSPSSGVSAVDLAERVESSGGVGWSGFVQSSGSLQVPDTEAIAGLAQLLGEDNDLRVWWRSADDWRVDRIRSTGEADLIRHGTTMVRWIFESETATISPVSQIRLPDASDLVPPTLARSMLRGVRADELSRLPSQRVAGIDAPGLRLVPHGEPTTVGHVDVWADPATGLPLRVELFGVGDSRPVLTTALRDLDRRTPPPETTRFDPAAGVNVTYDQSVDVAAAANAFIAYEMPAALGGLASRTGAAPGAVGVYGRGPTTLIAVPLRGQVAGPLRQRLRSNATSQRTDVGILGPVGPVNLLVTSGRYDPQRQRGGFLLAGTVPTETLDRAAAELLARS